MADEKGERGVSGVSEQTCAARNGSLRELLSGLEKRVDQLTAKVVGNGKPGLESEVKKLTAWREAVEKTQLKNETLFWRLVGPAIPYLWATVMGFVTAKMILGK